jgi:lipopolysaccharide export system protein LptC
MTLTAPAAAPLRRDMRRWKRRSRIIAVLRTVLPTAIALLVLSLATQVVWTTLHSKGGGARETPVAIRMSNPRFFGRDEQGRSFMIGAREATSDERDLRRKTLTDPTVALGIETPNPSRVSAKTGLYTEGDNILVLNGQVRIEDDAGYHFATEHALVDTKAGTVTGDTDMVGDGPVGTVASHSYSVYDKGARVIFKGGVRARLTRD